MRPGCRPERQQQVRLVPDPLVMPIGGANPEPRLAPAGIAPALQLFGEFHRSERLAALVEHHVDVVGGCFGITAAAIRKFSHPGRPADAFQVALGQLSLGRPADFSACDDVQQH